MNSLSIDLHQGFEVDSELKIGADVVAAHAAQRIANLGVIPDTLPCPDAIPGFPRETLSVHLILGHQPTFTVLRGLVPIATALCSGTPSFTAAFVSAGIGLVRFPLIVASAMTKLLCGVT
jgi:hypothetical protein